MNNLDKHIIIKCPKCGAEYLASEIFMPEDFLEYPIDILRTDKGIIEDANIEDACLTEDYICDYCNTKFTVKAKVSYNVLESDFDEEYTTKLD